MPIKELTAAHEQRRTLDGTRPHVRESLVWVVPMAAEGIGLVAYTWVDAFGKAGAAGIAFGPRLETPIFERVDGIPVPETMTFDDWQVGPLGCVLREPLVSSDVHYAGERLGMDFRFEAIHPPYAYTSHPEPFPSFFADDRLEQSGRLTGTLRLDGEEIALDGPCHRDHSFGARKWEGTLHYKWLNFLADDAAVHVMELQGYGRTTTRGYVHRDGETAQVVDASFTFELGKDLVHDDLVARVRDEAGRTTEARMLDRTADITYPIAPSMTLVDVVGHAEIDGAPASGYVEMAWPPEYLARNEDPAA